MQVHTVKRQDLQAGDFLISQSLIDELVSPEGYQRLRSLCSAGDYVVIPAFEVIVDKTAKPDELPEDSLLELGLRRARALVRGSKSELLDSLPQGWLAPFAFTRKFTAGHGPTDYTRCGFPPHLTK